MKKPLRILYLEDEPIDVALVQSKLEGDGIACAMTCVQTRANFGAALERGDIDLVLADFSLPEFDGLSALEMVHLLRPTLPFILVSGTLGEEQAVDSLKQGATDYVLKERLSRLVPAVRRAMLEVEGRSQRRKGEQALEMSEVKFATAFEQAPGGVALVSLDGRWLKVNLPLCELLGYSEAEMLTRTWQEITHPEDLDADLEQVRQLRAGVASSYHMEKRYLHKRGHILTARLSVSLVRDAQTQPLYFIAHIQDVTEQKQLATQFIEAQKMEVVGHLAGGVAHDFNNILAVIMGYSDLLSTVLGPDSPLHKYAEEIKHASERAAGLTRQLLLFSRKETVKPVVLELNDAVTGLDKMLRRLIGEHIVLTMELGKSVGRIKTDPGYLGQVLMNLIVNARDAMPNGGKLTVATSNIVLDENYTRTRADATPGKYVILSVSDTGTGMTDEVKARLFEAFFTTKPTGQGTGLGLITCQNIVKQSGGHISVYSERGQGTTFKVYFPRVEQPLDSHTEFLNKSGPLPRGTETILLVEDEPSLRNLASSVLETQGYQVLRANNGQDGLRVARENKNGPIHLIVTDVIMPQMGGKVMSEWLKATYPEIKVLFTSGYMDDAIARHGVLEPGIAFLPKPYTPAMLICNVREVLDAI